MLVTFFTNNLLLTCALFGVSLFYAWNLSAASDLVPSMIYFHLALALEKTSKFLKEPSNSLEQEKLEKDCTNLGEADSQLNSPTAIDRIPQDSIQREWQRICGLRLQHFVVSLE